MTSHHEIFRWILCFREYFQILEPLLAFIFAKD